MEGLPKTSGQGHDPTALSELLPNQVAAAVVRRDSGPTHGVLYLPRKGIIVEAARGHGCRINGELVRLREGQVRRARCARRNTPTGPSLRRRWLDEGICTEAFFRQGTGYPWRLWWGVVLAGAMMLLLGTGVMRTGTVELLLPRHRGAGW